MKIRHGHVSNSSSSSFLIVASVKDYDTAMGEVSALAAQTAKAVRQVHEVAGNELVIVSLTNGESDDGQLNDIKEMVLKEKKKEKETKVRGCSHELNENAKFCSSCGAPTWRVVEIDDYEIDLMVEEAFCEFVKQLKSMPGVYVDQESH